MPLALRGLLALRPQMAIMRISRVSRRFCNKVWNLSDIESLHIDVAVNLALLEIHFPPSFFDIMTHLLYHLMDELDMCGPIAIKWMYFVEIYMKTLKLYVHNMARPKA
jgi:hypothetical protein